MPEGVDESVVIHESAMSAAFLPRSLKIRVLVHCSDFGGSELDADIEIQYPKGHQTMSVVIPWTNKVFQYTSKHNCLPASAPLHSGPTPIKLKKGTAYACLDYGRGVWPYGSLWNWSSFSGKSNGHVIGVNLGGRWTDGTGLTENSLTCDGVITKLSEDVTFPL